MDCSAPTNGSGKQASPWNNLTTVNGSTFTAGDRILFKRSTTCVGQLWPKGSQVSGDPITLSAYGTAARPIINGNNAVDSSISSYWCTIKLQNHSQRSNPEWIRVDLGAIYNVGQVLLKWDSANRYATAYSIQVSTDGSNWTTVHSSTSGNGGTDTISFSVVSARYVQMHSTAWNIPWEGNYLDEFEIYP